MYLILKLTSGLKLVGGNGTGEAWYEIEDPSQYRGLIWLQTAETCSESRGPQGLLASKVVKIGPKGGICIS